MITAAAGLQETVITNGLKFHVDATDKTSYRGGGTNWRDLVSGVNGTITNTTPSDTGATTHMSFDGASDYIQWPDAGSTLQAMTSHTISIWMKYVTGLSGYSYLFSCGDASENWNENRYHISVNWSSNKFWWGSFGGATHQNDNTGPAMSNGNYYNVVFNSDGTMYSNGVEGATGSTSVGLSNCQTIDYFNIGALTMSGGIYGAQFYNGDIYQIGIYDRVLSASEVTHNYNALRDRYGV